MDDFTRGASMMQAVASSLLEALVKHTEENMRTCSKGIDHGFTYARLIETRDHYKAAAELVRSIKIQDGVS